MNEQATEVLQGLQRLLQELSGSKTSTSLSLPPTAQSPASFSGSPSIVSSASVCLFDGSSGGAADERDLNPVDPLSDGKASDTMEQPTRSPSPVHDLGGDIHELYNFSDANVTFKVQDMLFRVHRFFFERDSAFFRDVLLKDPDVLSGTGVVELKDCTAVDFERLLGVFYPLAFHRYTATSLAEWTSILALATQWGFESVRLLARREVFPLASAVDKVVLGHKYGIQEWLPDAYTKLCTRPEPLSDEEAERIGARDTARVARVREAMLVAKPILADDESEVRRLVEAEFKMTDGERSGKKGDIGDGDGEESGQAREVSGKDDKSLKTGGAAPEGALPSGALVPLEESPGKPEHSDSTSFLQNAETHAHNQETPQIAESVPFDSPPDESSSITTTAVGGAEPQLRSVETSGWTCQCEDPVLGVKIGTSKGKKKSTIAKTRCGRCFKRLRPSDSSVIYFNDP